jgi:hypothetical protein
MLHERPASRLLALGTARPGHRPKRFFKAFKVTSTLARLELGFCNAELAIELESGLLTHE